MVVPALTPYTIPATGSMVPTAVLLLVQVPADVPSVNVIVEPIQSDVGPEIVLTAAFSVIGVVTIQPAPAVYVMVTVPV